MQRRGWRVQERRDLPRLSRRRSGVRLQDERSRAGRGDAVLRAAREIFPKGRLRHVLRDFAAVAVHAAAQVKDGVEGRDVYTRK